MFLEACADGLTGLANVEVLPRRERVDIENAIDRVVLQDEIRGHVPVKYRVIVVWNIVVIIYAVLKVAEACHNV